MKLEKLTPEQEALMIQVRDEWLDRAFKNRAFDPAAAREGIEWLYGVAELSRPAVLFVSSPLGAQLCANLVRGQVSDQVLGQVLDQVRGQVSGQVRDQVFDQVRGQVFDQVRGQVIDQVRDQVRGQVFDQVIDKRLTWFALGWLGWPDFGWLSFYDFFERTGIVEHATFNRFAKFVRSSLFDCVLLDGLAIVCEPPRDLRRDAENRLHSSEAPCIEWSDGFKLWSLHGVFFEFELWEKVVNMSLTAKEILALENIEQRMIALKFAGAKETLAAMGSKLVDKSERGNELHLVENFFEESPRAFFLKYSCPSTGRVYLSGIDPDFAEGKKADECMAWKHRLTAPEYHELRSES